VQDYIASASKYERILAPPNKFCRLIKNHSSVPDVSSAHGTSRGILYCLQSASSREDGDGVLGLSTDQSTSPRTSAFTGWNQVSQVVEINRVPKKPRASRAAHRE